MHAAICDFVSDIFQNACEAEATRIELSITMMNSCLKVAVTDNGKGMGKDELEKACDPFYTDGVKHPGRRVGLGLPFLIQATEQCGGTFQINSSKGNGTTVQFSFDLNSIDCPPLGNMAGTIAWALCCTEAEVVVKRAQEQTGYAISRSQLAEALGNLDDAEAISLTKQYIQSQEENLISGDTSNG